MKRIFLTFAVVYTVGTTNMLHAQIAMNGKKQTISFISNYEIPPSSDEALAVENVNQLAIKDFGKRHAKAENVKWENTAVGVVASYNKDKILNKVVYDKNGKWSHTILYYNASNLLKKMKDDIAFEYDGTITSVREIHINKKVIHLVNLSNEISFRTIRICDGEMEVIEEMAKS